MTAPKVRTNADAPTARTRKPATPSYPHYRALKKLTVGKKTYRKGQIVPEAMGWLRVDAWVRSRHIELVEGPPTAKTG